MPSNNPTEESTSESIVEQLDQAYEYDREPVSEDQLQPARYFAGAFAGEHTAGTEFVIGALFVSWGAGAADVILGLALGNLLAVLSWALVCAPIAVETRLTLYWYLRRIAGPVVTVLYNVLNAILYCILAGAMITVSASALRIPFGIPPQTGWVPTDWRFVLVALFVGAVIVTIAIMGFKKLAQFASVCSPWLLIMFVAGGFATLPGLADQVPAVGNIGSFGEFWEVAKQTIWTGTVSGGEATEIGFWHVTAFAWITNLAMHLGMSDMALLRYAKKASYGFFSAFGMYLGHYVAWVAAGIMGAAAAAHLGQPLAQLDSGAVAYYSLGICGAVAVVIAGWTTSNPTLYRAGLALQAVTPGWSRWKVTLGAGAATTVIACLPWVFTQLLNFVALYGLLLLPIGTIVVVEHWLFPKIGYRRYWASEKGLLMNWPALTAWGMPVVLALIFWYTQVIHQFFLLVPTWILAAITYVVMAGLWGAGDMEPMTGEEPQKPAPGNSPDRGESDAQPQAGQEPGGQAESSLASTALLVLAVQALFLCFIFPVAFFLMSPENYAARLQDLHFLLLILSIVYFAAGTSWAYMGRETEESAA